MKKEIILILILSITIILSSFYITTSTAFQYNPGTQAYSNKISEMPYIHTPGPMNTSYFWNHGGDCDDRALAFKEYLESKGAKNVQICWVCKKDNNGLIIPVKGGGGHVFIVWDNRVYSPNLDKTHRFYGSSITDYKVFLKETYGFNTWYFENQTIGTNF